MSEGIHEAAGIIRKSVHLCALTGAGISVESGIPPFRGPDGLWSRFDPQILDIQRFRNDPYDTWTSIASVYREVFLKAEPNAAHKALASIEKHGILRSIITQNIDNLHQLAGSKTVHEYHGNCHRIVCPKCGTYSNMKDTDLDHLPPRCSKDGTVLKPDLVFFGEPIPQRAAAAAFNEASVSDVFLILGTKGEVMPASMIPRMARMNGAFIIEINTDPTSYTDEVSNLFLQGRAGEILTELTRILCNN